MDRFSKEVRSRIMRAVKSRSGIEVLPERFTGLFLRGHQSGIPGSPDFSNKRRKIALFIDGCFWHGCPEHYRRPKSNQDYWDSKLRYNRGHDSKVNRKLRDLGWEVIRIWECQL